MEEAGCFLHFVKASPGAVAAGATGPESLCKRKRMIDKQKLTAVIDGAIAGTDIFLVDVKIDRDNNIVVEIDSKAGLDIDTCVDLTRKIEAEFDRDAEDYNLEVGSAGLTSAFKVKAQYEKNIGNDVEVITKDGRKLQGVLTEAGDNEFAIEVATKVKSPGDKRPHIEMQREAMAYDAAKSVKYLIKFK